MPGRLRIDYRSDELIKLGSNTRFHAPTSCESIWDQLPTYPREPSRHLHTTSPTFELMLACGVLWSAKDYIISSFYHDRPPRIKPPLNFEVRYPD
eukprot:6175595-Pleurochrysis_carterae.AAC.3